VEWCATQVWGLIVGSLASRPTSFRYDWRMELDPSRASDVYFAARLAFSDRPDVRINLVECPGGGAFDVYAYEEPAGWQRYSEIDDPGCFWSRLARLEDLERDHPVVDGVGPWAVAARELWEHGAAVAGGRVERDTGRRSLAAEVLWSA